MPAVRTRPRDVLLKVPKVEPYSNNYVAPSVRAKNAATNTTSADAPAPSAETLNTDHAPIDASVTQAESDRTQRENSPILPFLSVSRAETQTIDMSKAATSSAGWNSLLIWARRQRGAQWDSSTAIWQVDKYSPEYYSFCEDPAQLNRSVERQIDTTQNGLLPLDALEASAEDDKGPSRLVYRIKEDTSATPSRTNSPPPVALGRSARLLRR